MVQHRGALLHEADVLVGPAARETLILEGRTHIDSLMARLREPRVLRVLDPMIAGASTDQDVLADDFAFVASLGLIRLDRAVGASPTRSIASPHLLDVPEFMSAWQTFWRTDGHLAAEGFRYKESGPPVPISGWPYSSASRTPCGPRL